MTKDQNEVIKQFVEHTLENLVKNLSGKVEITFSHDGARHIIAIKLDKIHRGIVIGRGGSTIKALQTLIDAMMPRGEKVSINIIDQN